MSKQIKKLAVVTGSRAEFGLMRRLMQALKAHPEFDLQVMVTGMHLSPEFGETYQEIISEGFLIDEKVEMLLSSDTPVGIAKSTGLGVMGMAECFERSKPDAVVLLGDRFETFAAATAATFLRIPIIHFHGGESTEGASDEAMRHSITKMAHLHFTSTETYRQRVIQLGEHPDRVFNVGAIGLDDIQDLKLLSRAELEQDLGFTFGPKNLVVTFHPVTLEDRSAETQVDALLQALDGLDDTHVIFTLPNADADGRIITKQIEAYVRRQPHRCSAFTSLGRLRYLSVVREVDGVVGNSSSGVIEVASMKKPTVNIGDRQKGRIMAESVICCEPVTADITAALEKMMTPEFQQLAAEVDSPYGDGTAVEQTVKILQGMSFDQLLKKQFYNLPAAESSR